MVGAEENILEEYGQMRQEGEIGGELMPEEAAILSRKVMKNICSHLFDNLDPLATQAGSEGLFYALMFNIQTNPSTVAQAQQSMPWAVDLKRAGYSDADISSIRDIMQTYARQENTNFWLGQTIGISVNAGGMLADADAFALELEAMRKVSTNARMAVAQGTTSAQTTARQSAQLSMASTIMRDLLEPGLTRIGAAQLPRRVPKTLGVRLQRLFMTPTRYASVAESPIGYVLKNTPGVKTLKWERGHVFIQQKWFRPGGPSQWYPNNPVAQLGLRRVGNAGINLMPMPRLMNGALGRSPLGTAAFGVATAAGVAAAGYSGYLLGEQFQFTLAPDSGGDN